MSAPQNLHRSHPLARCRGETARKQASARLAIRRRLSNIRGSLQTFRRIATFARLEALWTFAMDGSQIPFERRLAMCTHVRGMSTIPRHQLWPYGLAPPFSTFYQNCVGEFELEPSALDGVLYVSSLFVKCETRDRTQAGLTRFWVPRLAGSCISGVSGGCHMC
jgi:hypothetical protein